MLTLLWLNSSISLTNAISAYSPADSNTFRPKVFLNVWVQKCSILIPFGSCLILPILHSIESEPFNIRFSQTPELNQLFLGHPVTGDGWCEDGRFPDLLDFCKVCVHRWNIALNFLSVLMARPVLLRTLRSDKPSESSPISFLYSIK